MQARVAKRYAKALFDLATEQQSLDIAYNDVCLVYNVVNDNKELSLLLNTPLVTNDKKEVIINKLFGAKVSSLTGAYLNLIINKNRGSALSDISYQFISLYKEHKGITAASVTTAVPLKPETRSAIISLIEEATKKKVELADKVDASIIGGFIIKVGDRQHDTSINRKLDELKREFSQNIYLKDY